MTSSDVLSIVGTVFFIQLVCDLVARKLVYSTESYEHACRVLSRSQTLLAKLEANKSDKEKHLKKVAIAKNNASAAAAEVAKRHTQPGLYTSIIFVLLYRILSTEYQGKVVAILPFVPYSFVRLVSLRGIDMDGVEWSAEGGSGGVTDPNQACGFLFVYLLATLSVKFFVSHLLSAKPPKGAEGGIMAILDSPYGQRTLRAWGVDPDALRMD